MTFPGGLQSHELRVIGEHGQSERLAFQTNHQRQFESVIETVIDGHVQAAFADPLGEIVEEHVLSGLLDRRADHAVIKLFGPTQHGFERLRTILMQSLVVHIVGCEGRDDVEMTVRYRQSVQQHASTAVGFQRAELLQQPAVRGLGVAHRKNRVGGVGTGHIDDVHDAHVAQEHAHGLVFVGKRLELGTQTDAERVRERHHGKHIRCGNDGETGRALADDAHHFVDLLLA